MNYIELLNADLIKGYSKSDLELLIGLPKNSLSGVIKGDKKLSKISELKIEEWEASKKPSPLQVVEAKRSMQLAKLKAETTRPASGHRIEIMDLVLPKKLFDNIKVDLPPNTKSIEIQDLNIKTYTVEPENQNQDLITKYETELSTLGDGQFAKARKKWLTNKIYELKNK
ncbi:MAG: hypothetical protein V4547_17260 [Bacteroidota bacterium]